MKKRLEIFQEGLWGQRKKKITPRGNFKHSTDDELFIGAAFCSDVPNQTTDPLEKTAPTLKSK
jgi:hypothetical protein